MTIEKQMTRQDLVALIRERERKERIRDAAEDLLGLCKDEEMHLRNKMRHHRQKVHGEIISTNLQSGTLSSHNCPLCDVLLVRWLHFFKVIAKIEKWEVPT